MISGGNHTAPAAWPLAALMVAAAIVAGALAPALAAKPNERFYEGQVKNAPGEIEFVLTRERGKRKIEDFHADALMIECTNGFRQENFGIRNIRVHNRRFEVEKNVGGPRSNETAHVEGRLRRGGRATGTLRMFVGFDETPICDTGVLEWKASD